MTEENQYENNPAIVENETIKIAKGSTIIIIDPYAIETGPLRDAKPDHAVVLQVRRHLWGTGEIDRYIRVINLS